MAEDRDHLLNTFSNDGLGLDSPYISWLKTDSTEKHAVRHEG